MRGACPEDNARPPKSSRLYRRCILYIVRRTQLYLDDELWKTLHVLARQSHSTVSDLVRTAVREKYLGGSEARKEALLSVIGVWRDRADIPDSAAYVRRLRRGTRLRRLGR